MNLRFWRKQEPASVSKLDRIDRRTVSYLRRAAAGVIQKSWITGYKQDPVTQLRSKIDEIRTAEAKERREAIATVNAIYNVYGIPRENFYKTDNDLLAENAYYAMCEKAVMDYISTLEWEVIDKKKDRVESAIRILKKPNSQESFSSWSKQTVRDIIRYDAAVTVKVPAIDGTLLEFKAYHGPEFWIEVDREFSTLNGPMNQKYQGLYSHGYVARYWQHARPGYFIPFDPEKICYFKMYPRSDSPYGTDFISRLRYQLDCLNDATAAAGMVFKNGFMPGLIWEHPGITTRDQLDERIQDAELENQGAEQFGGILHTIEGEKITPVTPTMVDLQWIQGQKYLAQIIWGMFGFSQTDFIGGDANRATAYIQHNITKSQMLYPLIKLFEEMINTQILPYLPGYEEGWEFKFNEAISIDDEIKQAQLESQKASVVQQYTMVGMPAKWALKLAKVGDGLDKHELKELQDSMEQQSQQQMGGFGGMPPVDDESYMGTDTGEPVQKAKIIRKGKRSGEKNARLDIWLHC